MTVRHFLPGLPALFCSGRVKASIARHVADITTLFVALFKDNEAYSPSTAWSRLFRALDPHRGSRIFYRPPAKARDRRHRNIRRWRARRQR